MSASSLNSGNLGFAKILSIFLVLFLFSTLILTLFLSQKNLDIRNRAADIDSSEDGTPPKTEYAPNEVIVKLKTDVLIKSLSGVNSKISTAPIAYSQIDGKNSPSVITRLNTLHKISTIKGLSLPRVIKVKFQNNLSVAQVVAQLENSPEVEYAEPNFIVKANLIPNDKFYSSTGSWGQKFSDLYGIKKIASAKAWDVTTGSKNTIVAVIDTGVDRSSPDLSQNVWLNTKEIAGNGIDDDRNGYLDDVYGWNFFDHNNNSNDDNGHGTHVAGTIGAVGNNKFGVVGVNWQTRIMPVKFLSSNGSGYVADAAEALKYAADMGAKISSNSWGGWGSSQVIEDALKYEHSRGMVIVAAAGNDYHNNAINLTPAGSKFAITVSASDYLDQLAKFTNIGGKVDVAAPGVDILSVKSTVNNICDQGHTVGTNFCYLSGTSMSTPHVAGLAALLLSSHPGASNETIRQLIIKGASDLGPVGKDKSFGSGRINAGTSLNLKVGQIVSPFITSPDNRSAISGTSLPVEGYIQGSNLSKITIEVGKGEIPTSWTELFQAAQPVSSTVLGRINTTKVDDGKYTLRVTTTSKTGVATQFSVFQVTIQNFTGFISSPKIWIGKGTAKIMGTARTEPGTQFSRYTLSWGLGKNPTSWQTSGITLTSGGNTPIADGQLGTWDTSSFQDNMTYTLKLAVNGPKKISETSKATATVDPSLAPGFPVSISRSDVSNLDALLELWAEPWISDLDNDGKKEIVVNHPLGKTIVLGTDGSVRQNFPIMSASSDNISPDTYVSDLRNDGKKQILVVSYDKNAAPALKNKINIYENSGQALSGWTSPVMASYYNPLELPVAADLNGDGKKEIIAQEYFDNDPLDSWIIFHALDLTGKELPGFPVTLGPDPYISGNIEPPALYDVNGDGTAEIVFLNGGKMYIFTKKGQQLPGWPLILPSETIGLAIGDTNGDSSAEIFFISYDSNNAAYLSGIDFKSKQAVSGLPHKLDLDYYVYTSPVIADFNGDGKDDVLFQADKSYLYSNGNFKILSKSPAFFSALGKTADNKILTASIDDSIVNGALSSWQVTDSNGAKLWKRSVPLESKYFVAEPRLVTLKNNKFSLVAGISDYSQKKQPSLLIFNWNLPFSPALGSLAGDWPSYAHDASNTNNISGK